MRDSLRPSFMRSLPISTVGAVDLARWTGMLLLSAAALFPSPAMAQQGGRPTTLQLPTFSQFGVSTSVMVPDRGSAYLGGVNRAGAGARRAGIPLLFPARAGGLAHGASGASVHAQIHDLKEMDRELLGGGSPSTRRGVPYRYHGSMATDFAGITAADADPADEPPAIVQRLIDAGASGGATDGSGGAAQRDPALQSVAEIRRQRDEQQARQSAADDSVAAGYLEKARQAQRDGKSGLARAYYELAVRRASGKLREQALLELRGLVSPASAGLP